VVRERGIDLVHAHDYKANVLALALGRCDGIIPLTTEHGWNGTTRRESLVYYPADKFLTRFFPRVIAVSEDIRQELVRCGTPPGRVVTVVNGIDHLACRRRPGRREAVRAALGLGPDSIVIGGVGRLAPEKRFDLLVEALAALVPEQPHLNLLIAGEGPSKSDIEALARRLGVEGRVHLLGQRADVTDLHHAFDLFVQSSSYEGTPNVVLEAMAMETPLVATNAGGTAQLVRAGVDGLIVPMNRGDAIVGAVRACLADGASAAARAASARARVERDLSFDSRVRTVEGIYEELASVAGRRAGTVRRAA